MISRTLLALLLAAASTAAAQGTDVTTKTGVYTAAQADRGEAVFRKSCLECHVPDDYRGEAFKSKFVGGTAFDMFEQIRTSMPQSDPGSLTRQQYADVVAFLFKLNNLPTGASELPTEADPLKAIKVVANDPGFARRNRHTLTHGNRHGSPHIR
jgi:mono/diheme cytochrome c family protein